MALVSGQHGVLLRERGSASSRDSKTVRVLHFDVPPSTEAIALTLDYGPRVSTAREQNAALLEAAFELHTRRRRQTMSADDLARHREALGVDRRAASLDNLINVVLIDPKGRWRGRWDRNPSSAGGALILSREHASRGFL